MQKKKEIVMGLGQNFLLKDGILTLESNEWFIPIKNDYGKVGKMFLASEPKKTPLNKEPTHALGEVGSMWLHFVDEIRNHYLIS